MLLACAWRRISGDKRFRAGSSSSFQPQCTKQLPRADWLVASQRVNVNLPYNVLYSTSWYRAPLAVC